MACSISEICQIMNPFRHSIGLLVGGSAHHKSSTYTEWRWNAHIHALSGTWTHNPSVWMFKTHALDSATIVISLLLYII
jgi:hypothetical protein